MLAGTALLAAAVIEAQDRPADNAGHVKATTSLAKAGTAATQKSAARHASVAPKSPLAKPAAPAQAVVAPKPAVPKRPDAPPNGDVLVVALGSLEGTTRTEIEHTARKLVGGATRLSSLREVQMAIVRKSAPFGPVILLVPDETTKANVVEHCDTWEGCELLSSDRVRLIVANHQSPWIRDYGPQIDLGKDGVQVVHWRYYDTREDEKALEMRSKINEARLALIEQAYKKLGGAEDSLEALLGDETTDAEDDRRLNLLSQMDSILANSNLLQRNTDDRSAFDIAQAVLRDPGFAYQASAAFVDGGNLLRMGDGRCLTTRTLLSRNKDEKVSVDRELTAKGPCSQVIYLDPLPGPVIEHIDMFALPAGPKKILLASFDLNQPYVSRYWSDLSPEVKDLAFEAAIAMSGNARRLRALGYEVIEVPSPLPRTDGEDETYYPTMLNAVSRTNGLGETQILTPVYDEYQDDVQAAAMEVIKRAFGPRAQIVPIDATEAAKLQGAVHCLTLTLPLTASVFGDPGAQHERLVQTTKLSELEKEQRRGLPKDLKGVWLLVEEHEAYKRSALAAASKIFTFDGGSVTIASDEADEPAKGTYQLTRRSEADWQVTMKFPQMEFDADLKWIDGDHVRLLSEDSDEPHMLVRRRAASRH